MVFHVIGLHIPREIEALSWPSLCFSFSFYSQEYVLTFAFSDVYLKGINSKKI